MTTQRFFALSPDTVFAARVNEPSGITYPLSSVEFDTVTTGAFGDIKVGMTVLFGSTAGADDLGRKRIRAAADSNTIFVGRGSQGIRDGELNISDNDFITVIDTRSVWSKIPDIDGSGNIVKDEIAYTDQTDDIPPKANIEGGWRASTIDSGTSLATFQFVGTASYANKGTISTYLWDVDDGTITVGTSASSTITATFPAGVRWVKLTVTDSNGKSDFMEVKVVARDPDNDITLAAQCVEHRITQQGQFCSFGLLDDAAESSYPDGTPVLFWEGEPASAGDYSNVLFWGWIQSEDNNVTAEDTGTNYDTVLNCLDIAGRLDTLPGFPQSLTRDATPASWLEMAGLDIPLYMDYLGRWHSNAFNLAYYTSAAGTGYDIPIISSDGESIFDQIGRMAAAMIPDFILTCDRHGVLRVLPDPVLQETADRTATSQAAITSSNILAISWQHIRPPRIHWNWAYAIAASTSEVDYFATRAPGVAPGQGLSENNVNYKLAKSQDALNKCEGHRYAYLNAFNGQIAVTMATDLGIDPADMTWVTLTLESSYHRRQVGFSAARCLPVEVNIAYDYQPTGTVKTVELLLEEETSGTPGVTYEDEDTEYEWDPPVVIIPPPPTTTSDGLGEFFFAVDGYIASTTDLSLPSPSWNDATGSITGTIHDVIRDPYDNRDTLYASSTDGFWKTTNFTSASPTWTQIRTAAQIVTGYGLGGLFIDAKKISGSINSEGFVAFWHGIHNSGSGVVKMCCTITTDGGTSWSYNTIHSTGQYKPAEFNGAADYLPHLVGGEVVLGASFELQAGHIYFSQSTDSGATWSAAEIFDSGSAADDRSLTLHYPFDSNLTGQTIWLVHGNGGGNNRQGLWKTTDGGSSWSKINSSYTTAKRHGMESHTQDINRLFHWREDGTLWLSDNGGTSWVQANATGVSGTVRAAGGFPRNNELFYVLTTDGIYVSLDRGETFADKTGDWANGFATSLGNGSLAPSWTA